MDTAPTQQLKILLVEDEVKIAEFVIRGLNKAGYAVEHFVDVVSGLNAITKGVGPIASPSQSYRKRW